MRNRGQVSIEFIFIFIIALVYLMSVVEPGTRVGEAVVRDIMRTVQTRSAAETIANSINELHILDGEAKKTIRIIVPEDARVGCDATDKKITFYIKLSEKLGPVSKCPTKNTSGGFECNSKIALPNTVGIACETTTFDGPGAFTIELIKNSAGTINVR